MTSEVFIFDDPSSGDGRKFIEWADGMQERRLKAFYINKKTPTSMWHSVDCQHRNIEDGDYAENPKICGMKPVDVYEAAIERFGVRRVEDCYDCLTRHGLKIPLGKVE